MERLRDGTRQNWSDRLQASLLRTFTNDQESCVDPCPSLKKCVNSLLCREPANVEEVLTWLFAPRPFPREVGFHGDPPSRQAA